MIFNFFKTFKWLLMPMIFLVAINFFYSFIWIGQPLSGRVINKANGQVIAGAVVIVNTVLVGFEGYHLESVDLQESVTDEKGYFRFQGWRPKLRLTLGHIEDISPTIYIFHPDYTPAVFYNSLIYGEIGSPIHLGNNMIFVSNIKDGTDFKVDMRNPDKKSAAMSIDSFSGDIKKMLAESSCASSNLNLTKQAVVRELEKLKLMDSSISLLYFNADNIYFQNNKCKP